ncbi:MAG: hypothetical protein CL878_09035 [Dehalococcoidia bacterium]|nr:hypothetical protein [Dehalococcoidia bacterium]
MGDSQAAREQPALTGRVALITGAGGGIGRATALRLAQAGARIAAVDLRLVDARETAEVVSGAGGEAWSAAAEVTDASAAERTAAAVVARWGRLDVLVNTAGVLQTGTALDTTPEDWRRVLEINLTGTFLWSRAALPHLLRKRGAIVNLSSLAGRTKSILAAPSYAASKAGVIGMTMTMAGHHAQDGVRINCVAPGPTDTPMITTLPPEQYAQVMAAMPMGRLATPDEIAEAIYFLASDAASFITGQCINVNGGVFMA